MNADFEKIFFKELRAILNKNDFLKLNTSNYFYNNIHIQCMFNIQKSKYSKQYYFNLYVKKLLRISRQKKFLGERILF